MRNPFLSIIASGLLLAGVASFTAPDPQDSPKQKNVHNPADPGSGMRRQQQPALLQLDTPPVPRPKPEPVPLPPDTIRTR